MKPVFDRIILGSNPFIGVSYLSRTKSQGYLEKFTDVKEIVKIIEKSIEFEVESIMCSNNTTCLAALDEIAKQGRRFSIYSVLPNAYDYSRGISRSGAMQFVRNKMKGAKLYDKVRFTLRAGMSFLSKKTMAMLGSLVDLELLPFRQFEIKAVILHGSLTDLGLAFGNKQLFEYFMEHITENYEVTPGFATHNFGKMVSLFHKWRIEVPLIIAPFNKTGFLMNPSRGECLKKLDDTKSCVMAKKVLSAGRIAPREALEYISHLENIKSIIVGVGSVGEAEETFSVARRLWKK